MIAEVYPLKVGAELEQEASRRPHQPLVMMVIAERIIRSMLSSALRGEGLEVECAVRGQAALDQVRRHRPRVILVDPVMPDMDCLEFVQKCRTLRGCRKTPVVVLASTDQLLHARAPLHGEAGIAVITKPFELDDLITLVVPLACRTSRPQHQ